MQTVSDITILDEPEVDLIDYMGTDADICDAARVSTGNNTSIYQKNSTAKDRGLINYLMEHKHGSPFEHNSMKFYVKAPIFVFREFHRHRIGFSYNEMSGRYTELPAEFYVPSLKRPLVNFGTSARPVYRLPQGDIEEKEHERLWRIVNGDFIEVYTFAWEKYKHMLSEGIAKEVARDVLPVGIYSQMYVTCNARSLMHFLSLRIEDLSARYPSHPLYEIQQVALKMENFFKNQFPITYETFIKNGRVAP